MTFVAPIDGAGLVEKTPRIVEASVSLFAGCWCQLSKGIKRTQIPSTVFSPRPRNLHHKVLYGDGDGS